ncbi:MAG TPA: amino acid adenylation domain-containing protein [Pyrinomonadaceae bacterium]|nr:amino acid adenylation domain-containing protein [Pyrinomonadaceae bacterium]
MTSSLETLADVLRRRAAAQPERVAYRFLADGETVSASATYGELDLRARVIARCLREVAGAGERVLVLYPPGLEYVAAFFGCLYAGAVAVPAYPPRLNRNARRLQAIAADAQAAVALTAPQSRQAVESLLGAEGGSPLRRVIDTTALPEHLAADWREPGAGPGAGPDDLAFIQYTSGSTGSPRGVMLTHANLLHNSRLLRDAFGYDADSRCVSWLPMYHDMGLIGGILQPLYGGYSCTLMSPTAFLQSPLRWLRAVTRERATISGGPNFAYDLCVQKSTPEQRAELDLGSWEVAFNGSEPVRHETLERFREAFAPAGFRPRSFFACYGLAEATLIVSGGPKGSGPFARAVEAAALERGRLAPAGNAEAAAQTLVSSGACLPGQAVRIVEPETCRPCAGGRVGEIWVSGGSVARGYWNNAAATEQTFRAFLAGTNEGPFLRTGDLGVVLDGQLFVTGRLKDLIIIRGLNYYPHDIELTVEKCHPSFPAHAGAAFAVERGGEERLVVVQEVRRLPPDPDAVLAGVRQAVVAQHGIEPAEIALVRYGDVPKTSSGKIQRQECRTAFLAGALRVVCAWRGDTATAAPAAPSLPEGVLDGEALEVWLRGTLSALVGGGGADFPAGAEIGSAGLDSLKAVSLVQTVEEELGVRLSLSKVMQGMTLEALVEECLARLPLAPEAERQREDGREQGAVELSGTAAGEGDAEGRPLSYGQRGFWFLHQVPAELSPDNIHVAARVRRPLDARALRAGFVKLARRHEALRTVYTARQGSPSQHARAAEAADFFHEVEAAGLGDEQLREWLAREAHHRFDLEGEAPLRVHLLRHGPEDHTLLLVIHHSVADMRSLAIIARELGACYEAELRAAEAALPPVVASYHDFVCWQRELVAGPRGEELWRYWQAQLAGEPPTLNLPTDRPRPAVQSFRGGAVRVGVPPALADGLKALGEKNGASLYVTLLAAFQLLLHRYTGQEEQFVGTPVVGRTQARWNEVVGYFVNVLPLRARFDGRASFDELHAQVRRTVWEALEHQDYPFNLLVERLNPRRDPSRAPLVQAMFVFENVELEGSRELAAFALGEEGARLELGGLSLESVFVEKRATRFDLTLFVAETPRGLFGTLEYNADIFERASAEMLRSHWLALLEAVAGDPSQALHELPLLTAAEQHQLLVEWNRTALPVPADAPLHHQFKERARLHPEAVAVMSGTRSVSYGELRVMALGIARRLRRCGVGREARVAVMLRRGPGLVAALLGVLEAGAAYLPLDEQYPAERIEYMLGDAGVGVLVCGAEQAERWRGKVGEVLLVDEAGPGGAEEEDGSEEGGGGGGEEGEVIEGEQLAYVIYTSGSTGRPKGVAITHRNAATFLRWVGTRFTPQQLAGTLFSTSVCFDLSVFEIFAPLSYGGKIVVAENALQLPELPAAREVTLLNTVPSAMAELLRVGGVPEGVQVVNLAGEALPRTLVRQLYQLPTVRQVFNLYGPTEDTTYTTCEAVPRELTCNPAIGRPVADTRIYLLNDALRPVPVGVAGELYIGGGGLARGYLNRPGLTAERFIPDPLSGEPGARLYRTGDLARFLADGRIEYLGRADHQVKLRGFRIELGEVEAVLLEHAAVRGAAVVVQPPDELEKRLVAYLVAQDGQRPAPPELRSYLKTKLPEHMVPQDFLWLPELPLTPNGKLDRKALPAPPSLRAGGAPENYRAPATPTEELLAGIWRQVLRVERVGVEDDFFELGGHSLLAAQVASRIREACQVEVPIFSLFESPTVARLAELVDERRGLGATAGPDAIRPIPRVARRVKVSHDANGGGPS